MADIEHALLCYGNRRFPTAILARTRFGMGPRNGVYSRFVLLLPMPGAAPFLAQGTVKPPNVPVPPSV